MICSASLKLALLVVAARADSVPLPFAARVRAEVATRWSVDSTDLRLQWAAVAHPDMINDETPFHITGRGTDGWLLVVLTPEHAAPQAIRVRAGLLRDIPVAAHALRMGQRIGIHDIEIRRDVVWSSNAPEIVASPAGWEVRHDLTSGAPLVGNAVIAPRLIAAGDAVTFVWTNHGVRIEREALAVSPARLGELVQGQVGATRLTGRVTGPGTAQMRENLP